MISNNPTLSEKSFNSVGSVDVNPMTLQGTINKCALLLLFVCVPAAFVWHKTMGDTAAAMPWIMGGLIVGLVACLVTVFKKEWAPISAPIYAVAEGLLLGGISAIYETQFHGIVLQAVMLTVAVMLGMLGLYTTRIIQPTRKFVMGVVAATAGIALTYLVGIVLSLFGIKLGFLYGSSWLSIGISFVIVIVAALNLIIDFGVIEHGVTNRAPKYMEWYSAFGLLVTLIWLYMEILRLLSKFNGRRN